MTTPIGGLITKAAERAQRNRSQTYTAEAPCGCAVTITYFSADSYTYSSDRCTDHVLPRDRR